MQKILYIIGSISGLFAVGIGAFGAHGLKSLLSANEKVETFNTGVQYHFYHTFAIFLAGLLMNYYDSRLLNYAGWSFVLGILLFSFSLYALSISNISKLGIITPFGGLAFITGWLLILITVVKS